MSALARPVGPWFSTETPRSSLKRCFLKIRSERPSALTFPSPAPGPGGVVSAQHSSPSGTLCCSRLHRGSSPVFPLKWKDLPGETRGGSPPAMFPAPGTPQAHGRSAIKARRRREEPARPSRLQPRWPRNSIFLPEFNLPSVSFPPGVQDVGSQHVGILPAPGSVLLDQGRCT